MMQASRRTLVRGMMGAGVAACLPSFPAMAASSGDAADMARFIAALPKAEYHVHLEGTLEAEMKFALAKRNGLDLPFADVAAMKASYRYHDLPSFLAIYYDGMQVLRTQQDFYDLAYAYLARAASQNILYAEMFFDPQEHLKRGVPMAAVIGGITRARQDAAAKLGVRSQLILCFVRDLTAQSAMAALDAGLPFRDQLVAVGLDSDEKDNPPTKFAAHFAKARAAGLKVTAHCDLNQKDILDHLRQAIVELQVDRIDHGGNILESPELIAAAKARNLTFTVCPTFSGTVRGEAPPVDVVRGMIDAGLTLTINSDDPAYMGSEYLNDVLVKAQARSALTRKELVMLSRNAFNAGWMDEGYRAACLAKLDAFAKAEGVAI
ncbi:adenosine deaminase [Sphingobium rhizovicinum]|uniref:Adenine deaminase n=1 Tax=Sphingobium rhizovicinum TaxID=432308 RepID=A0ABV7NJF0_9SPHN